MAKTLGSLLGNDKLRAIVEDAVALDQEVGERAFDLELPELKKGGSVQVFDRPLEVSAEVSANVKVHAAGAQVSDLFGTGESFGAAEDKSLADLSLVGNFGASTDFAAATSPLQVSARAAAASGIAYRHVLPVRQSQKRVSALSRLVTRTRPPQLVKIRDLEPGEAHRLDASLELDFGLSVLFGKRFDVAEEFAASAARELFDGVAPVIKASGELSFRAALGLSLYENMYLAIGRAAQVDPASRWVRLRLQREHERRLSFSAGVSLQAQYDLGGSLAAILEHALGQIPTPRLVETLRAVVDPAAAGNWDAIKAKLTGELEDTVTELLDGTGWKEWLAGSQEVADFLEISNEIVGFYDGIDDKIQSWWDQLVGKVDLGEGSAVRKVLAKLTELDRDDFELEDLIDLSSDTQELIELIETFSDQSLEEILLSSDTGVRQALAKVATLARQAQRIFDLPATVLGKIQDFADRTGIAGTIDFLRQHATSKESLEQLVSERLRKVIERLAGKAWAEIDDKDLQKVQSWAGKIQAVLDAPKDFEEKILGRLRDLKGEIGFSFALEVDRVSRSSALIDFEVDPAGKFDKLHDRLEEALRGGSVRKLLVVLDETADDDKFENRQLPFLLRECVFTSRRVRTSSRSLVLRLVGALTGGSLQQGINRRVEESTVRVTQLTPKPRDARDFRRQASYSGGFSRTDIRNKVSNESAFWLEAEDAGSGLDVAAPYDDAKAVARSLRVTYARDDAETSPAELAIVADRMQELGFHGGGDFSQIPPRSQTRLTIDVRLPAEALVRISGGLKTKSEVEGWNQDYLAAAHRWFEDRLVTVPSPDKQNLSHGTVLAGFIMQNGLFRSTWTDALKFAQKARGNDDFRVAVDGMTVLIRPAMVPQRPIPPLPPFRGFYDPIRQLMIKRGQGLAHMRKLAKALAQVPAQGKRTPEDYETLMRTFADGWKATTVFSQSWPSSTFGIWLTAARLKRLAPDILSQGTGAAFLRWRNSGEKAWEGPLGWRLEEGQGLSP